MSHKIRKDIMTIEIVDCGKGLKIHYYLGIDLSETAIYSNLDVCKIKLKILWHLPRKMNIYELRDWMREHENEILSEIKKLVNEVIK